LEFKRKVFRRAFSKLSKPRGKNLRFSKKIRLIFFKKTKKKLKIKSRKLKNQPSKQICLIKDENGLKSSLKYMNSLTYPAMRKNFTKRKSQKSKKLPKRNPKTKSKTVKPKAAKRTMCKSF
jgi:ABC-type uncharacterized transport system ATPase subunit